MKCPALPHAGANDRRQDQQTTESDDGMASENAGEGYCSDNENPYDGWHIVRSFLLTLWIGREMNVREITVGMKYDEASLKTAMYGLAVRL
jgi:hypothetical protein